MAEENAPPPNNPLFFYMAQPPPPGEALPPGAPGGQFYPFQDQQQQQPPQQPLPPQPQQPLPPQPQQPLTPPPQQQPQPPQQHQLPPLELEINILLRLREAARQVIGRQVIYLSGLLEGENDVNIVSPEIETLRDCLEIKLNQLDDFNNRIQALLHPDLLIEDVMFCQDAEITQRRALTNASRYLFQHTAPRGNAGAQRFNTALPKLSLETFDGRVDHFTGWWDIIKAQIHDNAALSDAQKFAYIRNLLKGDAFNAVSDISRSERDYDLLITRLQERFGRVQIVQDAQLHHLLDLKHIKSEDNVSELRRHH
jgi:hypothetical protein